MRLSIAMFWRRRRLAEKSTRAMGMMKRLEKINHCDRSPEILAPLALLPSTMSMAQGMLAIRTKRLAVIAIPRSERLLSPRKALMAMLPEAMPMRKVSRMIAKE